jgi:hypothetical protein
MAPFWHFAVALGEWAQTHAELMLAGNVTLVLILGATRVLWRTARRDRRPKR